MIQIISTQGVILSISLLFLINPSNSAEPPDETGQSILDALNGVCPATCAHGEKIPGPKLGHLPYSNGCKIPTFNSPKGDYTDYSMFDKCCNLHDICYMTCGSTKKFCDDEYDKCLKRQCSYHFNKDTCITTANEMVMGRKMNGCKWYQYSQQFLCDCHDPEVALELTAEYATQFFAVFNKTHELPAALSRKYLEKEPDAVRQGELLYRLYKRYPEAIDIVARDGKTRKKYPRMFDTMATKSYEDEEDDNDEL